MIDPHPVRPFLSRPTRPLLGLLASVAGLVGGLAGTAGCDARAGDVPVTVVPNVDGQGSRISSVLGGFLGPAPWVQPSNLNDTGCDYPAASGLESTLPSIYVTGVTVTAVDNWDETGNGDVGSIYVQDTVNPPALPPIYSGISIFGAGFTPPSLRVLPGDVLDITGPYEEFIGPSSGYFPQCETLPQLSGSVALRFNGTVPAPVVVTPEDLSTFDGARQYLGMLVTVQQPGGVVSIAADGKEDDGRYSASVAVPSGFNFFIADELWDVYRKEPLSQGEQFESVTGILTYFYDFELAPRSCADFVLPGGATACPQLDAGADGG